MTLAASPVTGHLSDSLRRLKAAVDAFASGGRGLTRDQASAIATALGMAADTAVLQERVRDGLDAAAMQAGVAGLRQAHSAMSVAAMRAAAERAVAESPGVVVAWPVVPRPIPGSEPKEWR